MNPLVDFYYNQAEHIKYKDCVIDHEKNVNLLNVSHYLFQKSIENNLKGYFTGSVAAIFQFKKVYKTIEDIDLLIHEENLLEWMKIINSIKQGCGSYELFFSEDTPFEAIDNWKKAKNNFCITLTNSCSGTTIDLTRTDEDCLKYLNEIKLNDLNIRYITSEKFTGGIKFNRAKDIEDIKFLLQFEDARDYLLQFSKNKQIYKDII